jgi:hypothetical protein
VALITKRFPGTTDRAHKAVLDLVLSNQNQFWRDSSNRENMELIDKYYARSYGVTEDQIRARLAAIRGEAFRIQNFIAPIVLPQVESALGYLDSVFLTGHPIISVGAPPKYADTALSFATIIENNSTVAGWARNLHLMFRSGLKYSVAAAEIDWEQRRQVSSAERRNRRQSGRDVLEGQRCTCARHVQHLLRSPCHACRCSGAR